MINNLTLQLFSDDRLFIIKYQTTDNIALIVDYILVDYKKRLSSDQIILLDSDNNQITPEQARSHELILIAVQGGQNLFDVSLERQNKFIYNVDDKVIIEKYRNNRKTESIQMEIQTIKNQIKQFQIKTDPAPTLEVIDWQKQFVALPLKQDEIGKRSKVAVKGGQMAYVGLQRPKRDKLQNYTPQQISLHNKQDDAWTVYNGKVYDITLYNEYHPGGREKLMLGAGRDCTQLFNQFHSWINGHAFLEKDHLGFLVKK